MKKSILFPGQGSQYVGMGLDFYKNFKVARQTYQEVNEALKFNITDIIFNDSKGEINMTANTQPAIMTTGVAIFRVLQETIGLNIKDFDFCAGHSLGEYTALVCSEAISLTDASKLLRARGNAMQSAVKPGEGAMAAILGSEINEVESLIKDAKLISVEISNDNCPGQIVISGKKDEIEKCCEEIKSKFSKKSILLPVSAPFHCKLMKQASDQMKDLIMHTKLDNPKIPIITNVDAIQNIESISIKKLLIEQIYKKVKWREIIEYMFAKNTNEFYEIGPGKTLSGMLKRFNKNLTIKNFNKIEDLKI